MFAARAATSLFTARFGVHPATGASAPGRVNLIGEHTDYTGGPVLPLAIAGRTAVMAGSAGHWEFISSLDEQVHRVDPGERRGDWTDYLTGVVRVLERMEAAPRGAVVAVASTLPAGAGLSSSAALCVAAVKALGALAGCDLNGEEIAEAAYRAEHDEVGVCCGRMDQTIATFAQRRQALFLETRSGAKRHVPLRCRVWIMETGVAHKLSDGGLNVRVRECADALDRIRAQGRGIGALAELDPVELAGLGDWLPAPLLRRVRHVATETARTRLAAELLSCDDFAGVGRLLIQGHQSLQADFESSCPEADFLVEAALQSGAYGARLTGAGWGGAVIMLAPRDREDAIVQELGAKFLQAFGREPKTWASWASEGVQQVELAGSGGPSED